MQWFMNLKISAKLISAFIVVALIAGAVGIIGVTNIKTMELNDTHLFVDHTKPLAQIGTINVEFQKVRRYITMMVQASDPAVIAQWKKSSDDASATIGGILKEFEANEFSPEVKTLLAEWGEIRKVLIEERARIYTLAESNQDSAGWASLQDDAAFGLASKQYADKLDEIQARLMVEADETAQENVATAGSATTTMYTVVAIAVLAALGLGFFISSIISRPIRQLSAASEQIAQGDVDISLTSSSRDEIGVLIGSFQKMANNIRDQAAAAAKVAEGDLSIAVTEKSDKDIMAKSLNRVIDNLNALITEMAHMSEAHDCGEIDVRVAENHFDGAYRQMAVGVNNMVSSHIDGILKALACFEAMGKGDFDVFIERFPGKKIIINETVEAMRSNLKAVNSEITMMVQASIDGHLDTRADAAAFQGDWRKLIEGLNRLVIAITEPIQEASTVLEEMAEGNFSARVTGDYKGDHAKIKEAMNTTLDGIQEIIADVQSVLERMAAKDFAVTITKDYVGDWNAIRNAFVEILDALNTVMSEINLASEQVAIGSNQVAQSAQALSQGASEQAASIEEITASIQEIAEQTRWNADNANKANKLSLEAKERADQGNTRMKDMVEAMKDINNSSTSISKIIKVIDEIAFQTNILALNAAVEAARAGQHGKGFAVVAEEVRNLAARSANAAKETTEMIENSITKVEAGTALVNQTSDALGEILTGVSQTSDLVSDIAKASNDQATMISQINEGITQVSQVTQMNTATAEESAAASEEMTTQASMLSEMITAFQLRGAAVPTVREVKKPAVHKGASARRMQPAARMKPAAADLHIELDDKEFGKY